MTPPAVWVFDVDDTLYLEGDYVRSGFAAVGRWVRAELTLDGFTEEANRLFAAGRRNTTLGDALSAIGGQATPEVIAAMVQVYRRHRPDIALLSDARRLLDSITGAAGVAVITDGPADSQRAKVDALGLPAFADPVIVTEELGPDFHKPSPRAFELVARTLRAAPGDCVYVADNPMKDFVAPARLGWHTVRVRRQGSLHEAIPSGSDVGREVVDLGALAVGWE